MRKALRNSTRILSWIMDYETMGNVTLVKVSVFCLSSLRNEVKKLFYVQFFTNLIPFFQLILTLPKCTFDFNIAKMHIVAMVTKTILFLGQEVFVYQT